MVIEHQFITTLENAAVMAMAADFLRARGFVAKAQDAFTIGSPQWNRLEMTRGTQRHADPLKCIQQIHLEFDRGRVVLAVSMSPTATYKSFRISNSSAAREINPTSKAGRPYADILLSLAQALEDLLAKGILADQAGRRWIELETAQSRRVGRGLVRRWIRIALFLFLIALILYPVFVHLLRF